MYGPEEYTGAISVRLKEVNYMFSTIHIQQLTINDLVLIYEFSQSHGPSRSRDKKYTRVVPEVPDLTYR